MDPFKGSLYDFSKCGNWKNLLKVEMINFISTSYRIKIYL